MIISLRQSPDRAVTHQSPSKPEGRVLPFRPRGSTLARTTRPAVPDLQKFERQADEPDDFRHRMVMNGLALAVTIVLIVGGLWIAEVMAHIRKDQDCVLSGRTNCTPVDVPIRPR
jgi:hypothetical protein